MLSGFEGTPMIHVIGADETALESRFRQWARLLVCTGQARI